MNKDLFHSTDYIILKSYGFTHEQIRDNLNPIGPRLGLTTDKYRYFAEDYEKVVIPYQTIIQKGIDKKNKSASICFYKKIIDLNILKFVFWVSQYYNYYSLNNTYIKTFSDFIRIDEYYKEEHFERVTETKLRLFLGAEFALFVDLYLDKSYFTDDPFFIKLIPRLKKILDHDFFNRLHNRLYYYDSFSSIFIPNIMGDSFVINKHDFITLGSNAIHAGYHFVKNNKSEALDMCLSSTFPNMSSAIQNGLARGLILNGLFQDDTVKVFSKIKSREFQHVVADSFSDARILYSENTNLILSLIQNYKNERLLCEAASNASDELLPFFLKFKDSKKYSSVMSVIQKRMEPKS
jgi:hypothetical protein